MIIYLFKIGVLLVLAYMFWNGIDKLINPNDWKGFRKKR